LPTERLAHIYEAHEYMVGLEWTIDQTLQFPEAVRLSTTDPRNVSLYYRRFGGPVIKGRYICVVVKVQGDDAFVLTAYITGSIKRGETA
jgi:hypothetical protein